MRRKIARTISKRLHVVAPFWTCSPVYFVSLEHVSWLWARAQDDAILCYA
jgi:hypothetical protein